MRDSAPRILIPKLTQIDRRQTPNEHVHAVLMNSNDLDKLTLDLSQFFDFDNHNHIYYFHIWKGQFSLREMRSAASYSDIADRFESAIAWIKEVRKQDLRTYCPECGAEDDRVARVLSFAVMTGDDDVFRENHDESRLG